MSEKMTKETAGAYTIPTTGLTIPSEWRWLQKLNPEQRSAFFQEILDTIASTQQSGDWTALGEQIEVWAKQAEAEEEKTLAELRAQFISEGGPAEIASLLGKYRGQLSSVDEFIRNKQYEKQLEK